MIDPNRIKALAFDYYGTIADKRSLAAEIDVNFPGYGAAFTKLWFAQTQRYCFQNGMMERHIPWSELTIAAFNFACQEMDMTVSDKLRDQWIEADTRLPVYREAPAALARLGARFDLYVHLFALLSGLDWIGLIEPIVNRGFVLKSTQLPRGNH